MEGLITENGSPLTEEDAIGVAMPQGSTPVIRWCWASEASSSAVPQLKRLGSDGRMPEDDGYSTLELDSESSAWFRPDSPSTRVAHAPMHISTQKKNGHRAVESPTVIAPR